MDQPLSSVPVTAASKKQIVKILSKSRCFRKGLSKVSEVRTESDQDYFQIDKSKLSEYLSRKTITLYNQIEAN